MKQMPILRYTTFRVVGSLVIILSLWPVKANDLRTASTQLGRRFDTFGSLRTRDENVRLDNLADQLKKELNSKGYLVLYEGKKDQVRNLKDRGCRALRYLVDNGGVNANQVLAILIGGGHKPKFTIELLIWPLDAPDELPRFQPGVSKNEATIIRGVDLSQQCAQQPI